MLKHAQRESALIKKKSKAASTKTKAAISSTKNRYAKSKANNNSSTRGQWVITEDNHDNAHEHDHENRANLPLDTQVVEHHSNNGHKASRLQVNNPIRRGRQMPTLDNVNLPRHNNGLNAWLGVQLNPNQFTRDEHRQAEYA